MDGKNSFASPKVGLERLMKSDSQALISNDAIHNFEAFHCKVSIFDSIFEKRKLCFEKFALKNLFRIFLRSLSFLLKK